MECCLSALSIAPMAWRSSSPLPPADLYAEHIALAHCIDSYDQAAYRGRSPTALTYVRLAVHWPLPNWSLGVNMASL